MRSLNWDKTTIDVMTVENTKHEHAAIIQKHGMVPALCVGPDTMFVRQSLTDAAQRWYANHAMRTLPA